MNIDQINLVASIVNEDEIKVSSSHTTYASKIRFKLVDLNMVIEKLKKARKLAKEKGIVLKNTTKSIKELKAILGDVIIENNNYNELFDQYYNYWKEVDLSGDFSAIKKACDETSDLGHKMDKCFYSSKKISFYNEKCFRILSVIDEIKLTKKEKDVLEITYNF